MTQIAVFATSCFKIMTTPSFLAGFEDVKKRKPFNYLHQADCGDEWQYERGRQFALYLRCQNKKLIPLIKGNQPNWSRVSLLEIAFRDGFVI
jgi:hypothetical protein